MDEKEQLIHVENIQNLIFTIRNVQVILDSDLAKLYGVELKRLNEQVKRNIERFPERYRFQLTRDEWNDLRSQIATLKNRLQNDILEDKRGKHRKYLPYVFTEQGVSMLSAVLRSETAVRVSINVIDAFVEMKRFISDNAGIFQRLVKIEQKQIDTDKKFEQVFKALEEKQQQLVQGIFYDGQIFDAYEFVAGLIKKANNSIILIDNYIDETVLTMFSKNQKIDVVIYTKKITKQMKLDLKKYNSQYKPVTIKEFSRSHDRFLIIDNKEIYHFGASLKDLGKKWFAFSKMNLISLNIMEMLADA